MKIITVSKEEMLPFYPDGTPRENIGKYIDFDLFLKSCVEEAGQEMTSLIVQNYFKLLVEKKESEAST